VKAKASQYWQMYNTRKEPEAEYYWTSRKDSSLSGSGIMQHWTSLWRVYPSWSSSYS